MAKTKVPMSKQIISLMKANPHLTPKEVADKLGIKRSYVHSIIYLERRKTGTNPQAKKRVHKVEVAHSPIRSEIDGMKRQVAELQLVIAHLERIESRVRNGASV